MSKPIADTKTIGNQKPPLTRPLHRQIKAQGNQRCSSQIAILGVPISTGEQITLHADGDDLGASADNGSAGLAGLCPP